MTSRSKNSYKYRQFKTYKCAAFMHLHLFIIPIVLIADLYCMYLEHFSFFFYHKTLINITQNILNDWSIFYFLSISTTLPICKIWWSLFILHSCIEHSQSEKNNRVINSSSDRVGSLCTRNKFQHNIREINSSFLLFQLFFIISSNTFS